MTRSIFLFLALSSWAVADNTGVSITGLKEALSLTAEQVQAIETVRTRLQEAARPVLTDLIAGERSLRSERGADAPDATVVTSLEAQIANARERLETLRISAVADARKSLTPAQIATLEQLRAAAQPGTLLMQASQYNLIEPPAAASGRATPRPRANQGDFRSNGQRSGEPAAPPQPR